MQEIFKKRQDESDEDCIYRICALKEELGYTWPEIAEVLNQILEKDYTESKYRKDYRAFQKYAPSIEVISSDNEYIKKVQQQTDELYKAKKQFYDQRREYNKSLAYDARYKHLIDELTKAANNLNSIKMLEQDEEVFSEATEEALLCCSDWHFGLVTNNIWNEYNIDICVQRVNILLNKVITYCRLHNVNKLHIMLLGDFINGAIHVSSRVASEENTCNQLMQVSELLAEFINALSTCVNEVYVYSTYGNHARTIQKKDESMHDDNMERIIPWWLEHRLKENSKIHIINNALHEFIYVNILGHDIIGVHGDLENFNKLGIDMHTLFSKQYGLNVEYVFSGDKHHFESNDNYGIDNVLVSSLCGTDNYANNKRLYSKAGQTLCIFNKEDGKVCTFNITF